MTVKRHMSSARSKQLSARRRSTSSAESEFRNWRDRYDVVRGGHGLPDRIADMCGPEAAIDIFKNVAQIRHARTLTRRPGKRSGSHNPDMDKVLLDHFSDDPNSFLSLAKRGLLPGETRHFTKQEFGNGSLMCLVDGERRGATSGQQISCRLTHPKTKRNLCATQCQPA